MSDHKRSNVSKIFGNGMMICAEDNDSTDVDRGDDSNDKNQISSCDLKGGTRTKPTNSFSKIEFPLADKASQPRRLEVNAQTGNDTTTTTNENKLLCPDHQLSRLFADRLNYGSFQEECIHFARTSSLSTALPMQQLRNEFLLRESTGDVDLNWLRSKEYYKQRQSGKGKYDNIITQADRLAVKRHHDFKRKYRLDKDGLNDASSSLQPDVKFFSVVEFGRNNSNGAREHRSSGGITGRVIRVQGDGRCLFRSLITCLSPDLQKTRRDDFGTPLRREDITFETHMADALRAKVVKLMFDNAHFYGQLDRTVLNADVPVPTGYSHFRERLSDMTLTSTMPGDLELNATSSALERQVLVLNADLRPIVAYGKDRYPQSEVVAVRFTRLGPDVGHYDAVIPDLMAFSALDLDSKHGDTKEENVDDIKQYDTPYLMDCFRDLLLKSKNNSNDQMEYSPSPNKRVDQSTQASQTHGEEASSFENNKSQNATNASDVFETEEKSVPNQYEDVLRDSDVYFFAVTNEDETEMDCETALYFLTEKGKEKSHLKKDDTIKKTQKGPDSKSNCHLNTCDEEIDRTMKRVDSNSKKMARVKRVTKCRRRGKTPEPTNIKEQTTSPKTKKQTSLVQKWLKKRNKLDLKRIGESTTCFLCNKPMSSSQTSMAVCTLCGRVAHTQCVQPAHWGLVGGSRDGYFVCPSCLPSSQA